MSNRYKLHTEQGWIGFDWNEDGKTVKISLGRRGEIFDINVVGTDDGAITYSTYTQPENPDLELDVPVEDVELLMNMLSRVRQGAWDVCSAKGNYTPLNQINRY